MTPVPVKDGHLLHQAGLRRGPETKYSRWCFDPRAETLDREKLEHLQIQRLRATLQNAYANVPLHRDRMRERGVVPADIRSVADMQQLPFTYKNDLRDQYPYGMFARPLHRLVRLHASSGTTGKPIVVGYSKRDLATWSDLMARSLACAGVRPGDLVHNAFGYGLFTGGLGAHYGAERLGATVIPISGGSTERQVALIRDLGATVLCCTPSYALVIAETAEEAGMDLRSSKLRIGFFGAEPWSGQMRTEIEHHLGLTAVDNYGLSEILGPGIAVECAAQNGMHIWEDHFLAEIIDPDTGATVPEGQPGELVITTLTKEALPMIRFRTRDVTRMVPTACECGRSHRRLERMTGRSDDMLIIRGVNVFPSQVESVLLGLAGVAPHYQLVVESRRRMDHLIVEVESLPGSAADAADRLAAAVSNRIKSMIGISTEVRILPFGSLPRTPGKTARVRDDRARTRRADQAGNSPGPYGERDDEVRKT